MAKFLLLLLAFAIAYLLVKGYKKRKSTGGDPSGPANAEDMVRCAQCGVHLPRSESLLSDRVFYCSAAHRREHQKSD